MRKLLLACLVLPSLLTAAELAKCVHFLDRASFGADPVQLDRCLQAKTYESYVHDTIYAPAAPLPKTPPGAGKLYTPPNKQEKALAEKRKRFNQNLRRNQLALQRWWMQRMVQTDMPFQERMVLFWHTHFTSELRKVRQPAVMFGQYKLFSENARGNFAILLHEIVKDPAMLIYLDNNANRKAHPNENLARELLELYTLGEGHYGEADIKALARALTGYGVGKNKQFHFRRGPHDNGMKTLLGKTGNFDAHSAVDVILDDPETARFIVTKLWHAFVGERVDDTEVERLSALFRKRGYELKPLLYALFTSPAFTAPETRGKMIKSPIELMVGLLRTFRYQDFDTGLLVRYAKTLRQEPFNPPNVRGWRGGEFWIDSTTLLQRKAFVNRMTQNDMIRHLKTGIFELAPAETGREQFAADILLPVATYTTPGSDFNQTLRTILRDPAYQLK